MSNEPTQPTLFQQKAQLRLREKEAEWRRTLFERFRHICREEMREVMKSLLDTLRSPRDLELRKLEEIQHSRQQTQQEMHEMSALLGQTSRQVKEMTERLEKLPSSSSSTPVTVNTAALERETKELAERQEQQASRILARQETAFQDLQATTQRSFLKTVIIVTLICLLAMLGLKYLGKFTLVSEREITEQSQLVTDTQATLAQLGTQKTSLLSEIKNLMTTREALQTELRQNLEFQRELQQQTVSLQQLQEQFRFQLVKGATGGVFVEVPPEAQPFLHEGKTYIQVK